MSEGMFQKNFHGVTNDLSLQSSEPMLPFDITQDEPVTKENATLERPYLNSIQTYIPQAGRTKEDDFDVTFDTNAYIYNQRTRVSREEFTRIFNATINFFTTIEKTLYMDVQNGKTKPDVLLSSVAKYLRKNFPSMGLDHDFNIMMSLLDSAMLGYYVLQPLINHPETSDIKICSPSDIRVRVKGRAYQSNATFIDENDLNRFIEGIFLRNHVGFNYPIITFTDEHHADYILRFTASHAILNAVSHPYLHIRKVPKVKPDFDELIKRGMLDEKIKLYLIDRAKNARGIAFAGPPGSGKTTALNAYIEFIPRTRETLIIQENDELFTDKTGFMRKHVTHGFHGEPVVSMEELARMALVEGCNQFVIGEAKGPEMRYVMTLLNSGGYGALTLHSNNVYEILDKMADLVKYGSSYSFDEARRMLKAFDTLVYLEDYQVRDILEVAGYDDNTHQFIYRHIYHKS